MACGDVLSLEDLQTAKKHQIFEAEVITGKAGGVAGGATIGTATNPVTGQTQQTLPSILADLGFDVQSWTSSTGGVLASANQVFLNDTPGSLGLGDYYAWGGTFPKTVPAGTDPALPTSGYIMRSSRFAGVQAREALRRSYADTGYNLVTGSFEAGGTLVNANDVLLQESTGKAFSGPVGTVAAGTNPASGGFVNVSGSVKLNTSTVSEVATGIYHTGDSVTLSDRSFGLFTIVSGGTPDGLGIINAGNGNTAVVQNLNGFVYIDHYGAIGDYFIDLSGTVNPSPTDNTQAIDSALTDAKDLGYETVVGTGAYMYNGSSIGQLLPRGAKLKGLGRQSYGGDGGDVIMPTSWIVAGPSIASGSYLIDIPAQRNNISIKDIGIIGNEVCSGIRFKGLNREAQLSNVSMHDVVDGLSVSDFFMSTVENVSVTCSGVGVYNTGGGTTQNWKNVIVQGKSLSEPCLIGMIISNETKPANPLHSSTFDTCAVQFARTGVIMQGGINARMTSLNIENCTREAILIGDIAAKSNIEFDNLVIYAIKSGSDAIMLQGAGIAENARVTITSLRGGYFYSNKFIGVFSGTPWTGTGKIYITDEIFDEYIQNGNPATRLDPALAQNVVRQRSYPVLDNAFGVLIGATSYTMTRRYLDSLIRGSGRGSASLLNFGNGITMKAVSSLNGTPYVNYFSVRFTDNTLAFQYITTNGMPMSISASGVTITPPAGRADIEIVISAL